jgi:flavin reductase (DIM6/NTAB) family NADH-FMN oxidoreductase RutF
VEPRHVLAGPSDLPERQHFAVNVLDVSQQELALKFRKSSGEKFAWVEWKPGLATRRSSPGAWPSSSAAP